MLEVHFYKIFESYVLKELKIEIRHFVSMVYITKAVRIIWFILDVTRKKHFILS